jgi:hypothetical protein
MVFMRKSQQPLPTFSRLPYAAVSAATAGTTAGRWVMSLGGGASMRAGLPLTHMRMHIHRLTI